MLSSKSILPVLWEMAPNHRNLWPAYFADDPATKQLHDGFAMTPICSCEGANVAPASDGGRELSASGSCGLEGHIVQGLAPLPVVDGTEPVIGVWVVAGRSSGIGTQEEARSITGKTRRSVPLVIAVL